MLYGVVDSVLVSMALLEKCTQKEEGSGSKVNIIHSAHSIIVNPFLDMVRECVV